MQLIRFVNVFGYYATCLVRFTKYYYGAQIEVEGMGTCSTYGRDKKCIQNFGWKTCREENSEELVVDEKIRLNGS
jgi:hypothetical protein